MESDGGGWSLVHKDDMSSQLDSTDKGYQAIALITQQPNTLAVLPTSTISALGSTFRVVSASGQKMFWQGGLYTTEVYGTGLAQVGIQVSFEYGKWQPGYLISLANHGPCITTTNKFGEKHVCITREATPGIWFNVGWPADGYAVGTGWVR